MGQTVKPLIYVIEILEYHDISRMDLENVTRTKFTYSSYKEAIEYFVVYKNTFKNAILTLSAILIQENL